MAFAGNSQWISKEGLLATPDPNKTLHVFAWKTKNPRGCLDRPWKDGKGWLISWQNCEVSQARIWVFPPRFSCPKAWGYLRNVCFMGAPVNVCTQYTWCAYVMIFAIMCIYTYSIHIVHSMQSYVHDPFIGTCLLDSEPKFLLLDIVHVYDDWIHVRALPRSGSKLLGFGLSAVGVLSLCMNSKPLETNWGSCVNHERPTLCGSHWFTTNITIGSRSLSALEAWSSAAPWVGSQGFHFPSVRMIPVQHYGAGGWHPKDSGWWTKPRWRNMKVHSKIS